LYASHDIAEVQYALRFLTMDLKTPTVKSWERLKRVTKYLKAVRHEGVWYPANGKPDKLVVSTDSDWAGCKRSRKSTSCIVIQCGGCTLYTQSVGQSIHSQSSGEAEFYSAVSGVSAGLGLSHLLDFVGLKVRLELQLDSSAARGVLWRTGVGKIRHLEVKTLWVQDLVTAGRLVVRPVSGIENVADIGTKVLSAERILYLKKKINVMHVKDIGRASVAASKLTTASHAQKVLSLLVTMATGATSGTAALVVRADEDKCANVGEVPRDYRTIMLLMAVLFLLGLMCGVFATCRCMRPAPPAQQTRVALLDKQSQAPTTYTWKATTPRFKPLAEAAHG
jgi:hypothetical protein